MEKYGYIYSEAKLLGLGSNKEIKFSYTENKIFDYLVTHRNQFTAGKHLLYLIDGIGEKKYRNAGIYIRRINEKLGDVGHIVTKFGFGYRLCCNKGYQLVKLQNGHIFVPEDIITFYTLLKHYDIASANIGIVGGQEKYVKYVDKIVSKLSKTNATIIRNATNTKCSIFIGDIEYTYIHLKNYGDLDGLKFRKFI